MKLQLTENLDACKFLFISLAFPLQSLVSCAWGSMIRRVGFDLFRFYVPKRAV